MPGYPLLPDEYAKYLRKHGYRKFELTNHLGNVMAVLTDRKYPVENGSTTQISYYKPEVVSSQDYYAFGGLMPGRKWDDVTNSFGSYRYGFNGKEMDDEIYGEGNANTAMFWEYDTRLGRRLNIDPIEKVNFSSYSTFANNPLLFSDVEGLDTTIANNKKGNVIIWLTGTGNEVNYKKQSNQKNWDLIEAKSTKDAANLLEKYKSKYNLKINNVAVFTHGADVGGFFYNMSSGPSSYVSESELSLYKMGKYDNIDLGSKNYLDGISKIAKQISPNGSLVFASCKVGKNIKYVGDMAQLINGKQGNEIQLYFSIGKTQFDRLHFSNNNISTNFDVPLTSPKDYDKGWIMVERINKNLVFHFYKTSPGLNSQGEPISHFKYK